MTSRERVLQALRHHEPDRIPIDLGGTESSGITAVAYNRLRTHLGLPAGATRVFDVFQQVVKLDPDVRSMLAPDTVPLVLEPRSWRPARLPDGSPCQVPARWTFETQPSGDQVVKDSRGCITAQRPAHGFYFEPCNPPLAHVETAADLRPYANHIRQFDWPDFADESVEELIDRAQTLHTTTDLAVVFNLQCHLLAAGQILRGYENFMIDLLVNKELAEALLQTLLEGYLDRCNALLPRLAPYVDVVLLNDDLGTQNGPMLSLTCYRETIWPRQKILFRAVKTLAESPLLFHSCGAVAEFIPMLIEAGVDALNPVQVSASGMDTHALKRLFGKHITFWGGGCDTQHILCRGTPSQVRDEVRRRICDLAPGGGFVFTQVHNIQPDVPPRNILTMLEAVREAAIQ